MHLICLVLLVSSSPQQEPHHLQVTLVAGQRQGRLLELGGVGVDVGTTLEQELGNTWEEGREAALSVCYIRTTETS